MALPRKQYAYTGPISCAKALHQNSLSPQTGEGLAIGGYALANRSNAAIDVGLFARQPNALWEAGIIDASDSPDYEGASSGAKSTTANAFVNVFTTTNNDGFLILSNKKFNAISFVVDDAANGSPAYSYSYYDGTNMSSVTTLATPDYANTGATQLVFIAPSDWVAGTTSAVQTDNTVAYALLIRATTAPGKVVSISDVRVYECLDYYDSLSDSAQLIDTLEDNEIQLAPGYRVAAYFGSANANNMVSLEYRALSRQV